MEYIDFKKDFPERTIDILNRYSSKEKYDVTLLINCLTALLILPKERFYNQIPNVDIKNLNGWGLKEEHVRNIPCTACGYNLKDIVRRMRNAIAHMRIDTADENGNIIMIRFKDLGGFEVEIPVEDLKAFVKKLAEHVIGCVKSTNQKPLPLSMAK
ncbi:MAG TPA: HEPN family nuclease [Sedimentisphaerales bacterium]|nr:HEPN family nuclease [Sedimentisphaerales bacterium]